MSQDNNLFIMQESSCEKVKDISKKNNQTVGFDLHNDVFNSETPGGMVSQNPNKEAGLDEDLNCSSDEECQQLKNEKLEAARLNHHCG